MHDGSFFRLILYMNKSQIIYEHLLLELRRLEKISEFHAVGPQYIDGEAEILEKYKSKLEKFEKSAAEMGVALPLKMLSDRFGLNDVEKRIVLTSVLPFFMPDFLERSGVTRYESGYYILFPALMEKLGLFEKDKWVEYQTALMDNGKLSRYQLIGKNFGISDANCEYFIFGLKRIVDFLLGDTDIPANMSDYLMIRSEDDWNLSGSFKRNENTISTVYHFVQNARTEENIPCVILRGASRAEKEQFIINYARNNDLRVIEANLDYLMKHISIHAVPNLSKDIMREISLLNGVLLISLENLDFEKSNPQSGDIEQYIFEIIKRLKGPVFFTVEEKFRFSDYVRLSGNLVIQEVFFEYPNIQRRTDIWHEYLNGSATEDSLIDPESLAVKYRFTEDQIRMIVEDARAEVGVRGEEGVTLTLDDIHRICRQRMQVNFPGTVKKIEPDFSWEDLILSNDHIARLKELAYHLRHSDTVYEDWGFKGKSTSAKGIHVLFSGHSGTGKTMAAGVIAKETGLDLYRVDLAGVVDKYIGETEKNLSKIFDEAANSQAILFFDEADALFGKRSEVKDARDRYANIEVAYLLQKMEEYNGMTILATNLASNLDEAFRRRLHYMIEFPMPDKLTARKIWERVFPGEAPVGKDIDLDFLSNELQFSGGNIKNVALNAAFFAAEDDSDICMRHVMRSVRREFQKTGKPFGKEDMKKYYDMALGEVG